MMVQASFLFATALKIIDDHFHVRHNFKDLKSLAQGVFAARREITNLPLFTLVFKDRITIEMLDFATILRSPSFKVLVGKDHTCLTIHKCLAKDISPALHALMNNKHMVEARDGLAVLDDVEADTFVGFCEFAYTGDYRSRTTEREPEVVTDDPAPIQREEAHEDTALEWEDQGPPRRGYRRADRYGDSSIEDLDEAVSVFFDDDDGSSMGSYSEDRDRFIGACGSLKRHPSNRRDEHFYRGHRPRPVSYYPGRSGMILEPAHTPRRPRMERRQTIAYQEQPASVIEEAPAMSEEYEKKKYRTQATQVERIWKNFLNLTYEDSPCLVSDEQATLVNGDNGPAPKTIISLLYHAKIYVFAEKYLIDNLRILCLRKLHAALRDFDLTLQTSGLILEVLEFTYAQTERKESRDDELRMLLIHYAACKGEILKQNPNLRSLLEANGEMAYDLLYKHWGDGD